ncbi:Afadin and alpha-actinin-binding domain-containing protein [Trichoderma novae-zelandiae]
MIDTENLRTASLYINNQLLSRGLLRDGHEIDFADFGPRGLGNADSASRIISILNDLIIRRDRDADQRESLSAAVRNLRAENLKHTSDIVRLSEKCADAQRRSDIATTSEASLKTQLRSAESAIKGLKDELARTKGLVAQVRASCATEIRRRDRQIETLKKQVGEAGRARGTRSSSGVLSITVTGDVGNEERRSPGRGGNFEDRDYSLRSESNAFLAGLAQNLSEENEALLRVMQQAKDHLREMSGWTGEEGRDSEVVRPQGWEEMSSQLGAVMDHMRTILTNPSFVPIEEVMVREEEIHRLRKGFVKMESRWEDAVHLMDGWRKRMAKNGRPVGQDDIRMGLHLSPVRVPDVEETRAAARGHDLSAVQEESEDEMEDIERMPSPSPTYGSRHVLLDDAEEEEEDPEEDMYGYSDEEASGSLDDEDDELDADENDAEGPNHHMSGAEEAEDIRHSIETGAYSDPSQSGPLQNSSSAGNRGALQSRLRQKPIGSAAMTARGSQPSAGIASTETARQGASRNTARLLVAAQRSRHMPSNAADADDRIRIGSTTSLDEILLSNNGKETERRRENSRSGEHVSSRSGPAAGAAAASSLRANPRRMPVRLTHSRQARPQADSPSKTAIAVKLAAAEKQAAAARNRAQLRALRSTASGSQRPTGSSLTAEPARQAVARGARSASPVKREAVQPEAEKPEKRKRDRRAAKVSSRRRSTLSPFELQSLISGNVD